MESTLADIKQLFNVKAIAYNTTIDNLAEGQFGVFPDGSNTSVVTGTTFAQLPEKFRFISKVNGKTYFSFEPINKSSLRNVIAKTKQSEQINIWKGLIKNVTIKNSLLLKININAQELIQRDGLTWTHIDSFVEVTRKEYDCDCDSTIKDPVYQNNVITNLFYKKINASKSKYYEASVELEDGTAVTDVDAFVAANQAINTDTNTTNDGLNLVLVIKSKLSDSAFYRDIDINYVYPRAISIVPSLSTDTVGVVFNEVQPVVYEIGAGADLRAEEYENMNYYTDLNYLPRLHDGITNPSLSYQFENSKQYNTLTFEFTSDKTLKNTGDKKLFGVLLATEVTARFTELKNMFEA